MAKMTDPPPNPLGGKTLIVDAKDEKAKAFYEHFGFKPLRDTSLTLYLPLGR